MPRLVWLLALFLGCEDEVVPVQQAKTKKGKKQEVVEEVVVELTPEQRVGLVRNMALAGNSETAVEEAKAMLEERPEDPTLWAVLENASLDLDGGESLLASLQPDAPLAGQADQSRALRSALQIAGTDLESLKARALTSTGGEQAALEARVRLLEEPEAGFDRRADTSSPVDALVQFSRARDAREASRFLETALAVEGVDAALLRSEIWSRMEQREKAFDELGIVVEQGSSRQADAAILQRAEMVLDGGLEWPDDEPGFTAVDALAWSSEVTGRAVRSSDRHTAMAGLELTARAGLESGQLELAMSRASQVELALAAAGGDTDQLARATNLLSYLAYRAGQPQTAMRSGLDSIEMVGEESSELRTEAAWWAGLAAFQLQYGVTVSNLAELADGPRAGALEALSFMASGRSSEALSAFDPTGLSAEDRALVMPVLATLDSDKSQGWYEQAIRSADESGDLALRIRCRLAWEAELRARHDHGAAAEVRDGLAALTDSQGMKVELAVRGLLGGRPGSQFPEGDLPALVELWATLSSGKAPETEGSPALSGPVLSWAKGRNELRQGNAAYSHYNSVLTTLPAYRQGLLSIGTAMDGSQGLPVDMELEHVSGSSVLQDIGLALVVHEVSHRIDAMHHDVAKGRVLVHTLHHGPRQDILGAAARARAQTDRWLAGQSPYPEDAYVAVEAAEKHIAEHLDNEETGVVGYDRTFHKLMAAPVQDVKKMLATLRDQSIAVISYQQFGERLHGVALCTHGSFAGDLGLARNARSEASAHSQAMAELAKVVDREPDHIPGHRLRTQIFDPLASAFVTEGRDGGGGAKVGKYMLVAPAFLTNFNFGSLPVNQDGLQVLGRSYSFYSNRTLGSVDHNDRSQPIVTKPVFLGLTVPLKQNEEAEEAQVGLSDEELVQRFRSRLNLPPDLSNASRRFETSNQTLAREEVTRAAWFNWIRGARYIYLSEFGAGPNGEFLVHDGMVSLDEIRNFPIRAHLVVITSVAPRSQQQARAQAFLEAGAQTVLILGWDVANNDVENVIPNFLDKATENKVSGSRMALELRKILAMEGDIVGENRFKTAVRGAFMLYGAI